MKSDLLKSLTLAAAVALSFAPVRADDVADEDDNDDHERGGQVDGSEELEQKIRLEPTAEAPDGARGKAELEVEDEDGVTTGDLEVETEGLLEGTYSVTTTSLSDGTATLLGTFDVTASHCEDGDEGDDDQGEDVAGVAEVSQSDSDDDDDQGDNDNQGENETEGDCEIGSEAEFAFPDGFNALDIATVEIADASGVVVLRGDFTNLEQVKKCNLKINVQVTPGEAAPAATGKAAMRVRAKRHVVHQAFLLTAENVPANTSLDVKVNGQSAGSVRTKRNGKVAMRRLPRGISGHRVYSVSFDDPNGVRVLSAHF
jgi:hypothetical protein